MILSVRSLSKRHGRDAVVDAVSFDVARGETIGLLGPNGAGKSSLLRAILRLDHADSGVALFDGKPFTQAVRDGFRARLIVDGVTSPDRRTVRRHLEILCRLEGISIAAARPALAQVGLEYAAHKRIAHCSSGMKQRLGIATGWLAGCDLLVMDEPTNSLDADGPRLIWDLSSSIAAAGGATIIASHDVGLIARCCSRVHILNCGGIAATVDLDHTAEPGSATDDREDRLGAAYAKATTQDAS